MAHGHKDFVTEVTPEIITADKVNSGLDSDKSASPTAGDVYYARDTKILYFCAQAGTWTGIDASGIIQGALTLYANMLGGGFNITDIADPAAAQDAATKAYADALAAPGIANVAVGSTTRNASGVQAITGLGFTPKVVIFFARATGGTYQIMSVGFDNGTNHNVVLLRGDSVDVSSTTAASIYALKDISNQIYGYISSLDADGFTITWTLSGTLTVTFNYLAMK